MKTVLGDENGRWICYYELQAHLRFCTFAQTLSSLSDERERR